MKKKIIFIFSLEVLVEETKKNMANRITCNKEAIRQAYDEVRDDKNSINWAVFKYEGNEITFCSSGEDYAEFVDQFKEEERLFGFIRIFTGDELSKRAKFAFVTWIGASVNAIKRAKVSTEKGLVKEIITVSAFSLPKLNYFIFN